ncbi:MAG: hypothetical protein HZB59_10730 [Ignavibacteriales bacterium]|nr:hypothetical protein [Ignavibacteriales bacterium]
MGLVWKIFLEKVKNEARKSDCPKCHSKKVAEIFYGLIPSEFAQKIIGDGDMLGGCIISPNSPKWRCKSCKHEWGNVK